MGKAGRRVQPHSSLGLKCGKSRQRQGQCKDPHLSVYLWNSCKKIAASEVAWWRWARRAQRGLLGGWKTRSWSWRFSSVQFISVAQSCPTLCDPMSHSTPGLPVHYPNSCLLSRWCHPTVSSSAPPPDAGYSQPRGAGVPTSEGSGEGEPWTVALANFHGVNIPTVGTKSLI